VPTTPPFARLPDHVSLSLDEVATVLDALDTAELTAVSDADRAKARRAIRIITSKVWPELGDLLREDEE
jgi:hypothetical protein